MNAAGLLGRFNAVLGTDHRLETQGMQALLEDIRATTYDFGEAYGKVRPWWTEADVAVQGSRLYADIRARDAKRDDERKETIRRRQALQATTQPRRIWDLYSNRVLPLSVIPCEESDSDDDVKLPHSLWAVSHSWVADEERTQVWTSINRKQWPVPLPSAASLAHVRVELLNMGAEYVWIDVLCLRQQGRAEDEALRTEEWKTDVPTIGFVYQGEPSNRPCITYFNGLGLPLDTSPATLESSRHWFNRVWTLQESVTGWIPGGLAGFPLAGGEAFFSQVRGLVDILRKGGSTALVPGLMQRSCTTEMDRVAGLAYCMGCDSLPQYDAAAPLDTSWQLLIKTMGGVERLELFLLHFADKPFALFPSWKEFATGVPALEDKPNHAIFTAERLVLAQNDEVISDLPGQYYQIAETSAPCRISIDENKDLAIRFEGERVACRVALGEGYTGMHGVILQGVLYTLVRLHLPLAPHGRPAREDYWVVAEVVGEKKEAAEGMQSLTDVVKWGVILACAESLQSQAGWKTTRIMYVANEVALQRTQYRDQYMKAFEAMKAEGAKSIIMELST
ncbi:hypothetical protein PsYK624_124160 [Phanerochaete sordida]|uniref:Heterokaryon incompatibility domain-containing protein n=1 Tax=Phanerochaete sordida TaxID=48140 RepID=A0A9P3LJH3_9APHY|nr:hypothetical protein PsYK624_124160 [Phanerochaete sordida]